MDEGTECVVADEALSPVRDTIDRLNRRQRFDRHVQEALLVVVAILAGLCLYFSVAAQSNTQELINTNHQQNKEASAKIERAVMSAERQVSQKVSSYINSQLSSNHSASVAVLCSIAATIHDTSRLVTDTCK